MTIGFIGLGTMGSPMARNLLKHGYAVCVWARRPESMAPLVEGGAKAGESAAHVASRCDIVITMVTDTKAVEEVILGDQGIAAGARPGSLVIDHSTIDPGGVKRIASQLQSRNIEMLDAPVSGGGVAAEAGTLAIMAGGSKTAFGRAHPVLSCYAKTIVYIGASGAGQVAKACNQICTIVNQLGAECPACLAAFAAQLGWADVVETEIAVDAASLPIARITAVDHADRMQIARGPDRRAESGRSAANDRDVEIPLRHGGGRGQERVLPATDRPRR